MRNVMNKARILLVDQDELFRLWVRHMLESEEDMEIVGDCSSAEEALSQLGALSPNIILMDTCLPETDGIEACRHLTGSGNTCDVIMLSKEQEKVSFALSAGTTYFFPKDIRQRELTTAVRLICKWQSLRAENDSSVFTIRQIEAMIMENLVKAVDEQTHDDGAPEWLPAEGIDSTLREVALVIPSHYKTSRLQRFIYRVEETFQPAILETVGSWSDTHITFELRRPTSRALILDKLLRMTEVEKVEEKELVKARQFKFFKIMEPVLQKEFTVTLSAQDQLATNIEPIQYLEVSEPQLQMEEAMVS